MDKFNPELIDILTKHHEIGRQEAIQRIEMHMHFSEGLKRLEEILQAYGKTKKEIKKLLK